MNALPACIALSLSTLNLPLSSAAEMHFATFYSLLPQQMVTRLVVTDVSACD